MTIRQQIATLPEPYRTMAEKYEHNQGWNRNPTNWDDSMCFGAAFWWATTEEGSDFWDEIDSYLIDHKHPLPPLP